MSATRQSQQLRNEPLPARYYLKETPRDVSMSIRLRNSVGTFCNLLADFSWSSLSLEESSLPSLSARTVLEETSDMESSDMSSSAAVFAARLYIEAILIEIYKLCCEMQCRTVVERLQ